MSEHMKHLVDVASWATIIGAFFDALPHVAALLSVIWGILRLWEMWTGKTIAERRKQRRAVLNDRRKA